MLLQLVLDFNSACDYRRHSPIVCREFDGPALDPNIEYSGNIFSMLGRLNVSSLNSNVQHLVTTFSGHNSTSVSEALHNQPTQVTYSQQDQGLSVSIGSSRSSLQRALRVRGQVYMSRGWAASHLQNSCKHDVCADANTPLLESVSRTLQVMIIKTAFLLCFCF